LNTEKAIENWNIERERERERPWGVSSLWWWCCRIQKSIYSYFRYPTVSSLSFHCSCSSPSPPVAVSFGNGLCSPKLALEAPGQGGRAGLLVALAVVSGAPLRLHPMLVSPSLSRPWPVSPWPAPSSILVGKTTKSTIKILILSNNRVSNSKFRLTVPKETLYRYI